MTAERIAERGRVQAHDVEAVERGKDAGEHGRDDGEVLGDVVGDGERRQRATGDEQLLADLDDLDELGRVRVEVDHVPGFLRRLRAGVHGHADVGLGQRRGVVGAVAGHGDEAAARLLAPDQRHLVLGRRLGQEVVDAGLLGDGGGGERVVAGDHHRADAHGPQLVEALGHARLDRVLEADHAEDPVAAPSIGRSRRAAWRRRARCRPTIGPSSIGHGAALVLDAAAHRVGRSLADLDRPRRREVHPAHPGLGGERHQHRVGSSRCGRVRSARSANSTIERPSGVSSARLDSSAASASSLLGDAVRPARTRPPGGRRR